MTLGEDRSDDWKEIIAKDLLENGFYYKEQVPYRDYLGHSDFLNNDTDQYYDDLYDRIYDDDEPYRYKNKYYRGPIEENYLFNNGLYMVKKYIKGTRKGSKAPAYLHSIRVSDRLFGNGYSKDVRLAGLLHDIIEDGGYTKEQLLELGYSKRTVELVDLCSHDNAIEDSFERWQKMIQRLKEADDKEARAIKVCDITDNLGECKLMNPEKLERFLTKKAPVFEEIVDKYFKDTPLAESFHYAFEKAKK